MMSAAIKMMLPFFVLLGLLSGVNGEQECTCPCTCSRDDTYTCGDNWKSDPCQIPKTMEESGECTDIGGDCQWRRVTVAGTVTANPVKFTMQFRTPDGAVPFVCDVRLKWGKDENVMILNYKNANEGWARNAKRIKFTESDFSANKDYELAFTFNAHTVKVTNRGKELASYTLQDHFSWETINQVCVLGSTQKITVTQDNPTDTSGDNSEADQCQMPKTMEESGECTDIGCACQWSRVTVAGTVTANPVKFTMQFRTPDGAVPFVCDVRLKWRNNENVMVLNYKNAKEGWAGNAKRLKFTESDFSANQDYELAFTFNAHTVKVTNRGKELASYRLQDHFSWETINQVCVLGSTKKITVTQDNPTGLTTTKRDSSPPSCPSQFELIDGSCYSFHEPIRAKRDFLWKAARTECQGLAENADLVAIETDAEFNMITDQLRTRFPTPTNVNFWTGARFCKGKAKWVATGEETNLSGDIEPYKVTEEDNCGRIYYSSKAVYTHRGLTCKKLHYRKVGYVCEVKPTSIETKPSEDKEPEECTCLCGCEDPKASVCAERSEPREIETDQCLIAKTLPTLATSGSCVDIGSLCQGRRVTISGKVCSKFNRFTINFKTANEDTALNFDVRNKYNKWSKTINMNSKMSNKKKFNYAKKQLLEFKKGDFPFVANGDYALTFTVEGDHFKITDSNKELAQFKLRDPITWEKVNSVCIMKCTSDITVSLDNV